MKKMTCLIALVGFISISLIGCSDALENTDAPALATDEQQIQYPKEMTMNHEKLTQVKEIVANLHWRNAKVHMERPADYQFSLDFEKTGAEAEVVLYKLWISPNKDRGELVIEKENQYASLDEEASAKLFTLMAGKE